MPEPKDAAVNANRVHQLQNGKSIELGRLGLGDIKQCKQQCLHEYKREQIKTWTQNADLLPPKMRDEEIRQAFLRAETITLGQLPKMPTEIPVVAKNGKYTLDPETGGYVTETRDIAYEGWWMSDTPEGMLYATWLSMRRCQGQEDVTLDQADELFRDAQADLQEAAQIVGELTSSDLEGNLEGNSPAPPMETETTPTAAPPTTPS